MENNLKREIPLKREIFLKQDTPMWHFQPNQSGCCLRATEVKPKLDKFLIKLLVDSQKDYYLDKSKNNALDYKLWFEPIGKKTTLRFEDFPLFFGNIGADDSDIKQLLYYPKGVKMHLFSFNIELLNFVEENLPAFFAYHSFGTRQDKGFGFFSFNDKDKPLDLSGAKYVFELPNTIGENDFESLFQYINYFHKMIRSGINENGVYYKSFMYFYAKEKCNTTWDKPVIRYKFEYFHPQYKKNKNLKEESFKFIRDAEDYQKGNKENKIKLYTKSRSLFRDALGLASRQLWKGYSKDIITIQSNNKKDVVRFKSPITYRPIYDNGWSVYIYLNQKDLEEFKKYQFTIKNRNNSNEYVDYMGETKVLKNMRIYKDFSLEEYFDFIIQIGLDRHTDSKEHGNKPNVYVDHIFKKNNFKKLDQNGNTTK